MRANIYWGFKLLCRKRHANIIFSINNYRCIFQFRIFRCAHKFFKRMKGFVLSFQPQQKPPSIYHSMRQPKWNWQNFRLLKWILHLLSCLLACLPTCSLWWYPWRISTIALLYAMLCYAVCALVLFSAVSFINDCRMRQFHIFFFNDFFFLLLLRQRYDVKIKHTSEHRVWHRTTVSITTIIIVTTTPS